MKFDLNKNPIDLFASWLDEAKITEPNDPDAMSFATVSSDGYPSVRMVLLRKFDKKGFIFFTNYNSRKSNEINVNSKGALCFHWKSLRRQVRVVGDVERATEQESNDYYFSRPLGSRIGAWASKQSKLLDSRETLLKRVKEYEDRFEDKPPRPEFWGGFRLIPKEIEFWSDGKFRLHDRFRFVQVKNEWKSNRLYP
jgi:pyridoxamine 5'-phosphate oxidase